MAETRNDSELEAIRAMADALTSLDTDARNRVIDYVLDRFGIARGSPVTPSPLSTPLAQPTEASSSQLPGHQEDIRSFREKKAPRSAIQMATVVAYYLAELAPLDERKDTVNVADIRKYFVQASYPLPSKPQFTLVNAKNAGYFDVIEPGTYRLNPVGYNLVMHSLPPSAAAKAPVGARSRPRGSPPSRRPSRRREKAGRRAAAR